MKRKPLTYAAIAALSLAGAYLGATAIVAHRTHSALEQLQHMGSLPTLSGVGSFHDVQINEGFWSSSASADMDVSTMQGVQSIPVQATIDQWPSVSGPARVHMRLLVPDFGPVHDLFSSAHVNYVADGDLVLSWARNADLHLNVPALSATLSHGVLLKWAGAKVEVVQSGKDALIKAGLGSLSVNSPGKIDASVNAINLSYSLTTGPHGHGLFDLDVHGAQARQGGHVFVLDDATAHCAMSWDTRADAARRFVSVDQANVALNMSQPAAVFKARADAALPLTPELTSEAAISPLALLPAVMKTADAHLQVQADDGALRLIPALAQQAAAFGASKRGSLWTVQAEMQGGHVTVDGKSLS